MIKKTLFLVILIVKVLFVSAQSFSCKVIYDIKLYEDSFHFDGLLEFNTKESLFAHKKNKEKKWVRENEGGIGFQIIYTDSIGHLVYRKYQENLLTVRSFCELGKPVVFQDSVKFEWELGSGEKVIKGVKCKNAFTNFRGREYEAWYATEIPINAGPWKFCGLPGLIVEVSDKKGEVSILLKSLEVKDAGERIMPRLIGTSLTRKEFYDCLDMEYEKYYKKNKAIIAQLQAEAPDITITDNNLSKVRIGTELNFEQ